LIRRFCDRCIVMSHGKMVCFEQTDVALAEYEKRTTEGVAA
jgi:ABC-type polysaccharide/polyol phosphate transport system ATPase subunit